jgi:hypothetical protein
MNGNSLKWITSLEARGNRLVGNRRDCPEERHRLADEFRTRMAQRGITAVRDDEIEFFVEDETPLICARIRKNLISAFQHRQATDHEYLSLEGVAKVWAPLRPESPLTAAKDCARADLIEAALDELIPELLYLDPKVPLEYVMDADGKLLDPVSPDGRAAYLNAASLDHMLEIGPLPREAMKAHFTKEMSPHCWARREAVVALLRKLGIDRAELPAAWLQEGGGLEQKRGRPAEIDWEDGRECFFELLDKYGDFADFQNRITKGPFIWRSQASACRHVADYLEKHDTGTPKHRPSEKTIAGLMPGWLAEWRAREK